MQRDLGNELIVAIVAIGVLGFALAFGIILSLSSGGDPIGQGVAAVVNETITADPFAVVAAAASEQPQQPVPSATSTRAEVSTVVTTAAGLAAAEVRNVTLAVRTITQAPLSATPTASATATPELPTATLTPSVTVTPRPTLEPPTDTPSPSPTFTDTPSATPTLTATPTDTPTDTPTATPRPTL
ncbi:MAG: hypothetical protein GYB67_04350, partial [Chloroflexi bacterium]|nr:hypothetical protein [Chloroflexota bacterium]